MKNIIILFILAITLCQCNNENEDGALYSKNFVQGYIELKSMDISTPINSNLNIYLSGERITPTDKSFEYLSNTFGDIAYNRHIVPGTNYCISDTITSINIICETDYNTSHKSKSSLNNIIELYFSSPLVYINSGYKEISSNNITGIFRPRDEFFPYKKKLSEISKQELILAYNIISIDFIMLPENKNQILKFEIETINGKKLSQTKEVLFVN